MKYDNEEARFNYKLTWYTEIEDPIFEDETEERHVRFFMHPYNAITVYAAARQEGGYEFHFYKRVEGTYNTYNEIALPPEKEE